MDAGHAVNKNSSSLQLWTIKARLVEQPTAWLHWSAADQSAPAFCLRDHRDVFPRRRWRDIAISLVILHDSATTDIHLNYDLSPFVWLLLWAHGLFLPFSRVHGFCNLSRVSRQNTFDSRSNIEVCDTVKDRGYRKYSSTLEWWRELIR